MSDEPPPLPEYDEEPEHRCLICEGHCRGTFCSECRTANEDARISAREQLGQRH